MTVKLTPSCRQVSLEAIQIGSPWRKVCKGLWSDPMKNDLPLLQRLETNQTLCPKQNHLQPFYEQVAGRPQGHLKRTWVMSAGPYYDQWSWSRAHLQHSSMSQGGRSCSCDHQIACVIVSINGDCISTFNKTLPSFAFEMAHRWQYTTAAWLLRFKPDVIWG